MNEDDEIKELFLLLCIQLGHYTIAERARDLLVKRMKEKTNEPTRVN